MQPTRKQQLFNWLQTIQAHFLTTVRRQNKAVIVADGSSSLGAHRLNQHYYRPSPGELAQLETLQAGGKDLGDALRKMVYPHAIDDYTFNEQFITLFDERIEKFDFATALYDMLYERNRLELMGLSEFLVGSPNIWIREFPSPTAKKVHPVGSIDRLLYNPNTGKLCIMELKAPEIGENFRSDLSSRSLHLKQIIPKQVTLYAWLLLKMAEECGVPLTKDDIELYIGVANSKRKRVATWKLTSYNPKLFLGGVWESSHWHSMLDYLEPRDEVACSFCKVRQATNRTAAEPFLYFCDYCLPCMNECGKLAEYELADESGKLYFCSETCMKTFKAANGI